MAPPLRLSHVLLAAIIAFSFACGPPSSGSEAVSSDVGIPELNDETIRLRLNQTRVWDIPEENGVSDPINWRFFEEEPKEITVVEKHIDGNRASVVLDIKTTSMPRARDPRYLAGQIRTEWEMRTGWVLRRWEIVKTENISMKYRNLPKPSPEKSP